MPVTHSFISAKSDGGDATFVRPSNWNAGHVALYAPGSFTIATETGALQIGRLQLTSTQRATLAGTARLRII